MNNDTEIILYGLLTLSILCIIQSTIKLSVGTRYVRNHNTDSVEKLMSKKPPKVN